MNILLTSILLANVAILAIIGIISLKVRGIFRDIVSFITPPDEKTPSQVANVVSTVSDSFARSIVAQAKATFMGKQSGVVRAEKGVDADIAEDTLAMVNPTLSAILTSFPALRKTLRKNPALIDLALEKLTGSHGTTSTPQTVVNNGHNQFDMNL